MEPRKLPFVIGGIAMTIALCLGVVAYTSGVPNPNTTMRDIEIVMSAIALLVAMSVMTLYGIVTAFKDRNWLWFALIIVGGTITPANVILAIVYVRKVRRDTGANLPAAGWHHDPTEGHQFRYWNGSQWTEIVSDGGATLVDPMPSPRP